MSNEKVFDLRGFGYIFVSNGTAQTALSGNWTGGFWQMKTDWINKQFKNSKL
ncbi:MAG TPA: hypothetical protein VF571_13515 [Pyrinomonadaceae bacterium]